MKRYIYLIVMVILLLTVSGCGVSPSDGLVTDNNLHVKTEPKELTPPIITISVTNSGDEEKTAEQDPHLLLLSDGQWVNVTGSRINFWQPIKIAPGETVFFYYNACYLDPGIYRLYISDVLYGEFAVIESADGQKDQAANEKYFPEDDIYVKTEPGEIAIPKLTVSVTNLGKEEVRVKQNFQLHLLIDDLWCDIDISAAAHDAGTEFVFASGETTTVTFPDMVSFADRPGSYRLYLDAERKIYGEFSVPAREYPRSSSE